MLFTGLMITNSGPMVLEYNVRFGDPEAEVTLPLLSDDTDLAEIMLACVDRRLDSVQIKTKPGYAAVVVIASDGYPRSYLKGKEISIAAVPSGGFGGLFDLKEAGFEDPILISTTDGVGTKLKIAQAVNIHDTIGVDLVAMNVNDLVVQGAEPLFFLDYYACGKLNVDVAIKVVEGIANGCIESNCGLIGGETSEMPGVYSEGEYDLAGFAVGAVERGKVLPRISDINVGDVLIGIASSGLHSNGFSLVRKVIAKLSIGYESLCPWNSNITLGESLLTPTKIYVKQLMPVVKKGLIKAMAHITGGGFVDNMPRVLPEHLGVIIDPKLWEMPQVFKWLAENGNIPLEELFRTFNCGIGMVLIVSLENENNVMNLLRKYDDVYKIGRVVTKESNNGSQVIIDGITGIC
ncbi:6667_t:CDS:2 [Acaulospora colombiana]|uniref:6667_t:CDS:1 n=1 Tax=Acaulospora colombiana TaxID=27376 RepID=A0ACA9LZV4_9GLOM|nr:6667_t:CDS:2 [Acaulospora colombiana]